MRTASPVEAKAPQPAQLGADRRLCAVSRIDARLGRERRNVREARLHRRRIATRKIHATNVALKEHVTREQRLLAREIEARRAFGVTRRVERAYLEIGEIGER